MGARPRVAVSRTPPPWARPLQNPEIFHRHVVRIEPGGILTDVRVNSGSFDVLGRGYIHVDIRLEAVGLDAGHYFVVDKLEAHPHLLPCPAGQRRGVAVIPMGVVRPVRKHDIRVQRCQDFTKARDIGCVRARVAIDLIYENRIGAQDRGRGDSFGASNARRGGVVAISNAGFTPGEIDNANAVTVANEFGDRTAAARLGIVRMGAYDNDVQPASRQWFAEKPSEVLVSDPLPSNFSSLSKTVFCTPRRDRKGALAYARASETLPVG